MGLAALASTHAFAQSVTGSSNESATVLQIGDRNSATVDQQSSSGDIASVTQTANKATATVTSQNGAGIQVLQNGNGAKAAVLMK